MAQSRRGLVRHGVLPEEQGHAFLLVEKAMVESGIILLKYWPEVSEQEQTRSLEARIQDGRKTRKLTGLDLKSYSR